MELADSNVAGASCKVDEKGASEPRLFAVDAVAAAAVVSLHRADTMLRVSSTSSLQGS